MKKLTLLICLSFLLACSNDSPTSIEKTRELISAIHSENLTKVHELLDQNVSLNGIGDTILIAEAVVQGDFKLLKELLEAGADPFISINQDVYGKRSLSDYFYDNWRSSIKNLRTRNLIEMILLIKRDFPDITSKQDIIDIKNMNNLIDKQIPSYVFENMLYAVVSYEKRSSKYKTIMNEYSNEERMLDIGRDMIYACKFDHERLISLNKEGAPLSSNILGQERTPLSFAATFGNIEAVKTLKQLGVKLDDGTPAALRACSFFLSSKKREDFVGKYPLMLEVFDNHITVQRYDSIMSILNTM